VLLVVVHDAAPHPEAHASSSTCVLLQRVTVEVAEQKVAEVATISGAFWPLAQTVDSLEWK
jgi:hypothetical protein